MSREIVNNASCRREERSLVFSCRWGEVSVIRRRPCGADILDLRISYLKKERENPFLPRLRRIVPSFLIVVSNSYNVHLDRSPFSSVASLLISFM